jgi:hypothetical protein
MLRGRSVEVPHHPTTKSAEYSIELELSISSYLAVTIIRCERKKETGAVDHANAFHHAGLLVNEPPARGGLPLF